MPTLFAIAAQVVNSGVQRKQAVRGGSVRKIGVRKSAERCAIGDATVRAREIFRPSFFCLPPPKNPASSPRCYRYIPAAARRTECAQRDPR